jgi:hypothetical protein
MQALDHAAGYLLAFGVNAALCKTIEVSLADPETLISYIWCYRKEDLGKFVFLLRLWPSGSDRLVG